MLSPSLCAVKPGAELLNNGAEICLQYTISAHSPSRNVGHSERIETVIIMSVKPNSSRINWKRLRLGTREE